MNLEQVTITKFINDAAKKLQEEIDQEVMFDLLEQIGWTRVELANKWLPVTGKELHDWREKNFIGCWRAHNNVWMFEKAEDAVVFTLRWS